MKEVDTKNLKSFSPVPSARSTPKPESDQQDPHMNASSHFYTYGTVYMCCTKLLIFDHL